MSAKFGWQGLTFLCAMGIGAAALADAAAPEYAPSTYPENYNDNNFFPAAEVRALPAARAQASAAAAELRRTQSDLNNAVEDVRRQFAHQLRDAQLDEQLAYDALLAARESALTDVKRDSSYQALRSLRDRMGNRIEQMWASSPQETIVAMATVKLSYAATTTAMEVAAIAVDRRVGDAREHLMASGRLVADLNDQVDAAVHGSALVSAARKAVEDAQIGAVASEAFYREARNVANVSMDWAYYLRNHPYLQAAYSPYDSYPQFGYPIAWWQMGGGPALGRRR
ncbi:MAG TPA: hypothetical protein VGF52_06950 [Tepidisphaeraceae bacterium]|jgi:hypothetical protein